MPIKQLCLDWFIFQIRAMPVHNSNVHVMEYEKNIKHFFDIRFTASNVAPCNLGPLVLLNLYLHLD
jgi:hypothetical protein